MIFVPPSKPSYQIPLTICVIQFQGLKYHETSKHLRKTKERETTDEGYPLL